jgi:hypothetical protein
LKLKPSKCNLLQKSVEFLGHIVSEGRIGVNPEKVKAVMEWPTPISLKEVRGFVGLCSYSRRFVKDFGKIAAPLNALSEKNRTFCWDESCQTAFDILKKCLTTTPLLAMPNDKDTFILDTDASQYAIGAVLSQLQEGVERPVAYASRKLSKAEVNYCVTRTELLAIVYFLKYFHHYLLGRRFQVRTDHAALQWLRHVQEPVGQQARWIGYMEEFDFDIVHRPGLRHGNADAMSRRPCRKKDCFCGTREEACEEMDGNVRAVKQGTDYATSLSAAIGAMNIVHNDVSSLSPRDQVSYLGSCRVESLVQAPDPPVPPDVVETVETRSDGMSSGGVRRRYNGTKAVVVNDTYSGDQDHDDEAVAIQWNDRVAAVSIVRVSGYDGSAVDEANGVLGVELPVQPSAPPDRAIVVADTSANVEAVTTQHSGYGASVVNDVDGGIGEVRRQRNDRVAAVNDTHMTGDGKPAVSEIGVTRGVERVETLIGLSEVNRSVTIQRNDQVAVVSTNHVDGCVVLEGDVEGQTLGMYVPVYPNTCPTAVESRAGFTCGDEVVAIQRNDQVAVVTTLHATRHGDYGLSGVHCGNDVEETIPIESDSADWITDVECTEVDDYARISDGEEA